MIDLNEALRRVVQELSGLPPLREDDKFIVLDAETIEKPWGWVFFYTSDRYFKTGDFSYAVAGNAPLLVERETGRILTLGTARQMCEYIKNYERTGDPHNFG